MKFDFTAFFGKKENVYLVLALSFGLIMAVFNPPFDGVPDEHAHYWKSWAVAEGYWHCTGQDAIPQTAFDLPSQIKPVKYPGVEGGEKFVVAGLAQRLKTADTGGNVVIKGSVCTVLPFGYIPQAIGLDLGRLLHLSPLADFYLARILNLLAAVFVTYLAIRIVPFGKILFMLVGLLPMTIQQSASLGYDALHISLIMLFIAYVLRLANDKRKIRKKEIAILALLSIVALNVKPGYFPVAAIVFLLPSAKFSDKRKYWATVAGVAGFNVIAFLLIRVFLNGGEGVVNGVNPNDQLLFVVAHPFHFLFVMLDTIYGKLSFLVESFLFKPGWLKQSMPFYYYIFVIVGMILLARNDDDDGTEVSLTNQQRFILLGTFFVSFCLVYLSMYLVWTKVGADKISGVQGRYLLGIFPLLLFAFYKSKFNLRFDFIRKHHNMAFTLFAILAFFLALQTMYGMYYDKSLKTQSVYTQYLNSERQ